MPRKRVDYHEFIDLNPPEDVSSQDRRIILSMDEVATAEDLLTRPEPIITNIYGRFIKSVLASTADANRLTVPGIKMHINTQKTLYGHGKMMTSQLATYSAV